jgi:2-iminobutanoate/2-iminopropanoate deaminase
VSKSVIRTSAAPEAAGPYSQAAVANGFVFCSGQVAIDPATGALVGGTIGDQTERVLKNVSAVLQAAGSSLDKVVKVNAFLTDMSDFVDFNEAYGEFFSGDTPARATIGVASLPLGARVEVECVALA